jgi:hypothetical protein
MSDGVVDGEWEYRPLRIPPGVSRRLATQQLTINAELSGWELCRTLLFGDGTRKIWLRRKRTAASLSGPIT